MLFWVVVAFLMESVGSEDTELPKNVVKRDADMCYDVVGCFSNGPPYLSSNRQLSILPESPEYINTKLFLYTRESDKNPQELAALKLEIVPQIWKQVMVKPTKILIHGFLERPMLGPNWKDIKDQLLIQGDYNVIIVDWSGGNLPPYIQATANARVVGAQIGVLINILIEAFGMSASDFHIIGHSLGAHIAGYAGERVMGLGRITGLDPAGPFFQDADKRVRLDEGDATFVDVIHTNAKNLFQWGFGTKTQTGHLDFYPNSGRDQPGCDRPFLDNFREYTFIEAVEETTACNHRRALWFFNESINSKCPFVTAPCDSEDDFHNDLCNFCGSRGCTRMGYHADKYRPSNGEPTKYYFSTGDRLPFCRYHVTVTIIFASGKGKAHDGTIDLLIGGDIIVREKASPTVESKPQTFKPGEVYTFTLMLSQDVGDIQFVNLSWKQAWSFLNTFAFHPPILHVDSISVYRQEADVIARFCADDHRVQEGTSLKFTKRC